MWSVTSAIRSRFAIGQQNSAAFSAQQGAAAKMSMSRGAEGTMDEVYYAGLNGADADYDIQMLQDELNYEVYKDMEEADREQNK